jgi:hypothetical protein
MDLLQYLLFLGFALLLLLLRIDARRFGTAEYDDENEPGGLRGWLRRLTWYSLGIALVLVAYRLYPQPVSQLHLGMGDDRSTSLLMGLALGALGSCLALLYALIRAGDIRLPEGRYYPGAAIGAVSTAFIDEALFRGIILGLLLAYDWPPVLAIVFQAIAYGLVTRLGGPGRNVLLLLISIGMGLITGWLVLATGGIGAGLLGHAITRFSIFLSTGRTGQVPRAAWRPEADAGYGALQAPSPWEYPVDAQEIPPPPPPPGY